jgi:hypothetical protein
MHRLLRRIGRIPPTIVTREQTAHITRAGRVHETIVHLSPASLGDEINAGERVISITEESRYQEREMDGERILYPVAPTGTRKVETIRIESNWDGSSRIRKRTYREFMDQSGDVQRMIIEQSWEYQ